MVWGWLVFLLRGSEKYARPDTSKTLKWDDPVVGMANTRVRVESVLNDHFGMSVPMDSDGWKTKCPMAHEHEDGGVDRQFRVYSESNRGYCFAMHGVLDPVGLWRLRNYYPTIRDAAEGLLKAYSIDFRPKPYAERMRDLLDREKSKTVDPDTLSQAISVFLETLPSYEERQYDEAVLRSVNSILSEVRPFCDHTPNESEVAAWLTQAKARLVQAVSGSFLSTEIS